MRLEERLVPFVEESFLSPLLKNQGVTDISWNGESIFYMDNRHGRKKANIDIDNDGVGNFLRQIANFAEQQFSYMEPLLDVSFGRYRLNATFQSITRVNNKRCYSFSLRVAFPGSAVENSKDFFGPGCKELLLKALENGESIVIGGETGVGKTELQKFLLLHLRPATRVIVIDNVQELELSRGDGSVDMTSWLVDEDNARATFPALIRNALRNNPDYLLVAESRGAEMLDALAAVMSGHPIITTLHAKDIDAIPHRMARMAMQGSTNLVYRELIGDIYHHFSLLVFLKRRIDENGIIHRYIETIGRMNDRNRCVDIIYREKNS